VHGLVICCVGCAPTSCSQCNQATACTSRSPLNLHISLLRVCFTLSSNQPVEPSPRRATCQVSPENWWPQHSLILLVLTNQCKARVCPEQLNGQHARTCPGQLLCVVVECDGRVGCGRRRERAQLLFVHRPPSTNFERKRAVWDAVTE
jgi:hypothetical protein